MVNVVGKIKEDATAALSSISNIAISKSNATTLALRMKARYAQMVVDVYPQVVKLHPHCQGALLSLVINRGNSFTAPSVSSRREMKEIQDDLKGGTLENIPDRIRSMKRLWENSNLSGLLKRRDKEAEFFEKGMKCDCWQ